MRGYATGVALVVWLHILITTEGLLRASVVPSCATSGTRASCCIESGGSDTVLFEQLETPSDVEAGFQCCETSVMSCAVDSDTSPLHENNRAPTVLSGARPPEARWRCAAACFRSKRTHIRVLLVILSTAGRPCVRAHQKISGPPAFDNCEPGWPFGGRAFITALCNGKQKWGD